MTTTNFTYTDMDGNPVTKRTGSRRRFLVVDRRTGEIEYRTDSSMSARKRRVYLSPRTRTIVDVVDGRELT